MTRYVFAILVVLFVISVSVFGEEEKEPWPSTKIFACVKSATTGKWGYIDHEGTLRIKPIYDEAFAFSQGRAFVKLGTTWQCIDDHGNVEFECEGGPYYQFRDRLSRAFSGAEYYNRRGEIDVSFARFSARYATCFSKGLAVLCYQTRINERVYRKWAWFNTHATILHTEPADTMRQVRAYKERYAAFQATNGKWGFLDRRYNIEIDAEFGEVQDFSQAKAGACWAEHHWTFIDRAGDKCTDSIFAAVKPYRDNMAAVQVEIGGKWSFVTSTGVRAFDGEYFNVRSFSEGYAAVQPEKYKDWKIINRNGKIVYEMLKNARSSRFGLMPVQDGKLWGFVDSDQKMLIKTKFADARCFHAVHQENDRFYEEPDALRRY